MKFVAFCALLLVSGPVFAQAAMDDVTSAPNPSSVPDSTPRRFTPLPGMTALVPVPDSTASGGYRTEKITTPASGKIIQPDNLDPRRDNSGVVVKSDPAVVPDGWNGVTESVAVGGPLEDSVNVETVPTVGGEPLCSATITDHCMETYRQDYVGP